MKLYDRVLGTSTDTGTGPLAVTAQTDFKNLPTNGVFVYAVVDKTTHAWEIGNGSRDLMGRLVRTQVIESTNGNGLVNFAGNAKDIIITVSARNLVFAHYDPDNYPYGDTTAITGGLAGGAGSTASEAGVAIGISADAANKGVAIGFDPAAANSSISLGTSAQSFAAAIAIGGDGTLQTIADNGGIAIGLGARANVTPGNGGIAIGKESKVVGTTTPGFAIGNGANALDDAMALCFAKSNWPGTVTSSTLPDNGASSVQVQDVIFQQTITTNDAGGAALPGLNLGGVVSGGCIFQVDIVGLDASFNMVALRIVGCMRYGGIVGTPVTTVVGRSAAFTSAVTGAVTYNSGYLQVTVTGKAATEIRWGINGRLSFLGPRF